MKYGAIPQRGRVAASSAIALPPAFSRARVILTLGLSYGMNSPPRNGTGGVSLDDDPVPVAAGVSNEPASGAFSVQDACEARPARCGQRPRDAARCRGRRTPLPVAEAPDRACLALGVPQEPAACLPRRSILQHRLPARVDALPA